MYLHLHLYLGVSVDERFEPTWCSPIVQMQIGRLSTLKRLRSAAFIRPLLIKILRKNWSTPTASPVRTSVLMGTKYLTIQRLGANYET